MKAQLMAAAAIVVGLAHGSCVVPNPPRPIETREGYRVVQVDLHSHTRFSDGTLSPCDLVLLGRQRGLDALAVTEHNQVFPGRMAQWCSKLISDAPLVLTGAEITTAKLHLLAIGIDSAPDARSPTLEVIGDVHRQGGAVIIAHPTSRYQTAAAEVCAHADGIEVVHPLAYRGATALGRWGQMVSFAEGPCGEGKAMIGNSDYHGGSMLGLLRTYAFVGELSSAGIVDAIRSGRTVTRAPDGRWFGPEPLRQALQDAPLSPRATDYDYAPLDWADRLTRLLGLLGAVLLFALPTRARARLRA